MKIYFYKITKIYLMDIEKVEYLFVKSKDPLDPFHISINKNDVVFLKIIDAYDNAFKLFDQVFTFITDDKGLKHIHYYMPILLLYASILKISIEDDFIEIPLCINFPASGYLYWIDADYAYTQYFCVYDQNVFKEFHPLFKDNHLIDLGQHKYDCSYKNQIRIRFPNICCKFLIIYFEDDNINVSVSSIKIDDQIFSYFVVEWYNKLLYVVSFVKNDIGEYVNDVEDLYEIFTGKEKGYFESNFHTRDVTVSVDVLSLNNEKILKYFAYC